MKRSSHRHQIIAGLIVALLLSALLFFLRREHTKGYPREYAQIEQTGTLRVVTEYNSIGFYVEGDTISGFHYELAKAFAQAKGLKLELTPLMSFSERLEGLNDGTYDLIASDLLATSESKKDLLLTLPLILNKQVLVQRKAVAGDSGYIKSQLELAGKTLHVVKESPSILRIRNMSNEIGDTIYIQEVEKYGTEQLLAMVAHGDIDYAVCDEEMARASLKSMPQLDIQTAISFTQFYSWGVSKASPILLDSLNNWIQNFREGRRYREIFQKYYGKRQ